MRRARPVDPWPFGTRNTTRLLRGQKLLAARSARIGRSGSTRLPSPINCHHALGRQASHSMTPLRSQLSMFGVGTLRGARPAAASALAVHSGASPIFQHRSGGLSARPKPLEPGLPGCPSSREVGGWTGLPSLYVPFDTPISRRQAADTCLVRCCELQSTSHGRDGAAWRAGLFSSVPCLLRPRFVVSPCIVD